VGLLETVLIQINHGLTERGLNMANGQYLSSDATLIKSARCPRKVLDAQAGAVVVSYADDQEAPSACLRLQCQCHD